jgi:hypothetical protein
MIYSEGEQMPILTANRRCGVFDPANSISLRLILPPHYKVRRTIHGEVHFGTKVVPASCGGCWSQGQHGGRIIGIRLHRRRPGSRYEHSPRVAAVIDTSGG